MKILLATDLYLPAVNGVVTSTVSLKQALEDLGHEVRILTLSDIGYIDMEQDIYAISSMNISKIYPGARIRFFRDRPILTEIIHWKPDLIHTQSEFSAFQMAKYITHYLPIPIVHTYHTVYEDYTHYFSPSKKMGRKIVAVFTKTRLKEAQTVIAPTNKVARLLNDYEVKKPIHVIPTGIELNQFQCQARQEQLANLKQSYGIPENKFLILSLGRLGKEKNIEELLQFLSMVKLKPHFLIVGDGPDRYHLEKITENLGLAEHVTFTGMIAPKDVAIYYQVADLFVSASTSETQGLTYIEALASGLPVLCRADESIENVILDDKNGFQYRSLKEFEACLYTLMKKSDDYYKMKKFAEYFANQHYSSTSFGKQIEQVYKNVVKSFPKYSIMQMNR